MKGAKEEEKKEVKNVDQQSIKNNILFNGGLSHRIV